MNEGQEVRFGRAIKEARDKLGFSQKDIAQDVDISAPYLSDLERGRRGPPPDHVILKLADALGATPDYLFFMAARIPLDLREVATTERAVSLAWTAFRREL